MNDDYELLQAYAARGSEESFARLVERYVNLVHSAAWRQTRNDSLAQEITQTVFLILARKAGSLSRKVILPGWLLQTTRFAAANAMRREQRRQKAEDDLMNSTPLETPAPTPASWDQISAELDEAIGRLGAGYRDAIALRFFEKKSLREVAEALGTTEDNAQKKVTRGLEKLRSLLGKRGASVSTGLLAALIGEHAVSAAPLGLPALVITAVARSGGVAAGVAAGVSGTLHLMALQRLKALLLPAGSGLAVAIFISTFLWHPVVSGKGNPPRPGALALADVPVKTPAEPVATPAQAAVAASSSAPNENLFQFRVIDALTESAVTNVRLTLVQTQPVGRSTNTVYTGKDGIARLPWPDRVVENWSYRLEVYRDGYVPKYVSWGATQGDKLDDFPAAYSTRIDRGTRIGGSVVNEQGSPIPGVKLVFSVSGSAPGSTRERERLTMMGSYHSEVTDDGGRWSCDHVPLQFGRVDWRLSHPYYQDTSYGSTAPEQDNVVGRPRIPMADLEKGAAVMTMNQGLRLAGVVVDGNSRPVAGAKVSTDRNFEPGRSLYTDPDGRFEFRNARPKATVITVQAPGFAPDDRTVNPGPELEEQRFVLQSGSVVRGRVVTETAQPVTNASVYVAVDERNRQTFERYVRTDAQGRFEWTNAPLGREFQVNSASIMTVPRFKLPADGSESTVVVKLNDSRKRVVVKIEAVDAVTQEPLRSFRIKTSEVNTGGIVSAGLSNQGIALPVFSSPRSAGSGSSGQGTVVISSYTSDFFVEVSADGYLPARATNRNAGQGELTSRLELRTCPPIIGKVQKPDGSSAVGAMAVLCLGRNRPSMTTPKTIKIAQSGNPPFVMTDTNGVYTFQPELEMKSVIIADENGFAEAVIKDDAVPPLITLQPWATVRGQLKVTGKDFAFQKVTLQLVGGLGARAFQETTTDENGRFVFEGVPPGEFKVGWYVRIEEQGKARISRMGYATPVMARSGETAEVILGGSGCTVVGSVSAEGIAEPIDWRNDTHTLTLQVAGDPKFAAPVRTDFGDDAAYAAALAKHFLNTEAFWDTDAGRAVNRSSRLYIPWFDTNGNFQIPDVLPGTYELEIAPTSSKKTAEAAAQAFYPAKPLGKLVIPVVISESQPGSRIDLGRLVLRPAAP